MTCRFLFLQGNVLCNEATTPLYLPLTPGKRRDTGNPSIPTIQHTHTHHQTPKPSYKLGVTHKQPRMQQ